MKPSSLGSSDDTYDDDDGDTEAETSDERSASGLPGNVKGTLVHLCMEYLILSNGAAAAEPELLAERITDEKGSCFDSEQREESIKMLTEVIRRMTSGGSAQKTAAPADLLAELFSERTDEIYCELPFVYTDGAGALVSGVIDLLYRQGDKWHIIDYKTNHDAKDLEKDPVYAAQLACYRRAVIDLKKVPEEDVDAHIYHIKV